jgi:ATP-dependent RNA helicase RhlE
VGRTARAVATGEAYTLVSPEEESDLRQIERAVGKPIKRVTLQGFDYNMRPAERFEVPIGERIKEIRARKAADRERAKATADAKAARIAAEEARRGSSPARQPSSSRPGERRFESPAPRQGGPSNGYRQGEGGGSGNRRRRRGRGRPALQS